MTKNYIKFPIILKIENNKKTLTKLPKWKDITVSQKITGPNYAIRTGEISQLTVIDLDVKRNAKKWFEENISPLEEQNATIIKTPSGGYHLYYKYNKNIKTTTNWNDQSIDIRNDNAIVFAGEHYDIIKEVDNPDEPPKVFKTKTKTNQDKQYEQLNKKLNLDKYTEWTFEDENGVIKYTPNCLECLVNKNHIHSHPKHSALFFNKDKTVVKSCHSHGTEMITDKKLIKELRLIVELETKEQKAYETLIEKLEEEAFNHNYKRELDTGNVYKPIKKYAYKFYKTPKEFIRETFKYDKLFKAYVNNVDNMAKFMRQFDSEFFEFIEPNNDYIGFKNGILNKNTLEFTSEQFIPENLIVKKYIDQEFTENQETPLIDKILDYQFNEETKDFIYTTFGRIINPSDNFGYTLYLMGEAGTGKSLLINIVKNCVSSYGSINDNYEQKFGLSYLHNKDLIICDDLPKDIHHVLPQQTFQTMVTNGDINVSVKGGEGFTVKWTPSILFAGNWYPSYVDKGQISRRIITANFEKPVISGDPMLEEKILTNELPAFILKCLIKYNHFKEINKNKTIWNCVPEYFLEQKEDLIFNRNPLYAFLFENTRYLEGNIVPMNVILSHFNASINGKVQRLDSGTFGMVDMRYTIERVNSCKSCGKVSQYNCCENYNRKNRSRKTIVKNIEIVESWGDE